MIARTAGRVFGILAVLARHALRTLVRALRARRAGLGAAPAGRIAAGELTGALAELGPTFIKLGQVLSTRPDLVPPVLEEALVQLQDAAPTVPREAVHEAVLAALGAGVDASFASFEDEALAAASIGQVHAATLADGREVVVKVRRPGATSLVELDLSILAPAARLLTALPGPIRRLDLVGFVAEFAATIRAELDYVAEGCNADRLRPVLAAFGVRVPLVEWSRTCSSVLTLERIFGAKIDDLAAIDAMDVDRSAIARTLTEAYLSMVFVNGFFHADPHPGNLFIEASGRIAMVDFGMTGTVAPAVRRALVEVLLALSVRDPVRSANALGALGVVPHDVDLRAFTAELERLTAATVDVPLRELRLAPLLRELMTVSRHHRLHLPRELALLVKTVVMCEGLAAQLDPEFSLAPIIEKFVAQGIRPPEA